MPVTPGQFHTGRIRPLHSGGDIAAGREPHLIIYGGRGPEGLPRHFAARAGAAGTDGDTEALFVNDGVSCGERRSF